MLVSTVEMVSGMTGGRAVRMAAKGDLAFASLTAGLGGYYRLGVRARPEDLDGKPHQISLKVTKSGARLAGHRRVLAATAKAPSAPVDAAKALRAALESPTPAIGLELSATSYVLHGTEAGQPDAARRGRRRRGARVGRSGDGGGGAVHAGRSAGDRDRSPARARRCRHDAGHGLARRAARHLHAASRGARRRRPRRQRRALRRRTLEAGRAGRDARAGVDARRHRTGGGAAAGDPGGDDRGAGDRPGPVPVRGGREAAGRLRGAARGGRRGGERADRPDRGRERRHQRRRSDRAGGLAAAGALHAARDDPPGQRDAVDAIVRGRGKPRGRASACSGRGA